MSDAPWSSIVGRSIVLGACGIAGLFYGTITISDTVTHIVFVQGRGDDQP